MTVSEGPTPEQIEAYRRDGFLTVEEFMPADEVERVRERFHAVFEHAWETGLAPDEVNYHPGVTPPEKTRQMCNVWKADRVLAATTLSERNGRWAGLLSGEPGMRIAQDNMIWKPPSGKALLCHQDAAYLEYFDPKNMTTCWIALDDTSRDTGTIYYLRGSNHWGPMPLGGQFHAPDQWLYWAEQVKPADARIDPVPIEVPAGGAAFHDGWTFHGSPPNERADAQRRSIISHFVSTRTRWNATGRHPLYSRYMRPGSLEMDEAFFPIVWSQDGYRSAWIDELWTSAQPAAA